MKLSGILGSLSAVRSSIWSSSSSSMVVPLPSPRSLGSRAPAFNNLKLSFKKNRNSIQYDGISATHLLQSVTDSITSQNSMVKIVSSDPNPISHSPTLIEECLEDGVELLDACNYLLDKIEFVRGFVGSIQMAAHLIKPGMAPVAITRVMELLDRRRYESSRSKLKLKRRRGEEERCDALTRSTADAVDACQRLDRALSFKRGRRPSAGGPTEQMVELRDAMRSAKRLRDLTAEKGGEVHPSYVEALRDTCQGLVEGVGPLEERVKELYAQLICVRMTLFGILSQH